MKTLSFFKSIFLPQCFPFQTGRFLPACLFLLFFAWSSVLCAQDGKKHEIGLEYLNAAQIEFKAGRNEAALLQTNRGIEVDPRLSDLYLLRSQIKLISNQTIREALVDAEQAVKLKTWVLANNETGITELVAALIAMHAWKTAAGELSDLISEDEIVQFPVLLAQKVMVLFEIGDFDTASRLLKAGFSRHPDNFSLMNVAIHYRTIPTAAAFLWFNRFHSKSPEYITALFWYLHHLEPSAERLQRCEEYLTLGGNDPMVFSDGLEAAQTDQGYSAELEKRWLDRFLTYNGLLDLDVASNISRLLRFPDSVLALSQALNSQRLMAIRDYDRDGRAEETMEFERGRIISWTIDSNQNGLAGLKVDFAKGIPIRAWQFQDLLTIRLDYFAYPEVATVWLRTKNSISELVMPHRAEEIRFIDIPQEGLVDPIKTLSFLNARLPIPILDPIRLGSAAWLVNDYSTSPFSGHRIFRQTRLEMGRTIAQRFDSNNAGFFDAYVLYDNGVQKISFRDAENDNSFPMVEFFAKGKPIEYRFVSSNDGTAFSLLPSSGMSKWDLNRDNRLDYKELLGVNNWLHEIFSARNDTNFDTVLMASRYDSAWKLIESQGIQ